MRCTSKYYTHFQYFYKRFKHFQLDVTKNMCSEIHEGTENYKSQNETFQIHSITYINLLVLYNLYFMYEQNAKLFQYSILLSTWNIYNSDDDCAPKRTLWEKPSACIYFLDESTQKQKLMDIFSISGDQTGTNTADD